MKQTQSSFEIYDFYEPSLFDNIWIRYGIFIFLTLITVSILYWFFKKKKKTLSPGQVALQELQALTLQDFSNKKKVKTAYFAITSVIKRYLHDQWQLAAQDKTDDELIKLLEEKSFHVPTGEAFKKIHHNALWVKFANYDLIKTQVEQDITIAIRLVEELDKTLLQEKS